MQNKIKVLVSAILILASFSSIEAFEIAPNIPDPCTLTSSKELVIYQKVLTGYLDARIYGTRGTLSRQKPDVVVIVNGNGYILSPKFDPYLNISTFLAENDFLVIRIQRTGGNVSGIPILDMLDEVYSQFSIDPSSKMALIGHSAGGSAVSNAAIENYNQQRGYNIESVIHVAPNTINSIDINGKHASSYFSLYGSRDKDMAGLTDETPTEGFAGYDNAGTERSTTCSTPPCWSAKPRFEKYMAYVHGADHAEFLGTNTRIQGWPANAPPPAPTYLSLEDQFCIGKGYINAFLRYEMRNEKKYKDFLRGKSTPMSFRKIKTSQDDGLGEPAGSSLRVYNQFSPPYKQSIENFEDSVYSVASKSRYVRHELISKASLRAQPFLKRHQTQAMLIGWQAEQRFQFLALDIPSKYKNASRFTDLSIRIGQLKGAYRPHGNNNKDKRMWIALIDSKNRVSWERLNRYGKIPRSDRHSAMNTITIPLSEFSSIDLSNVKQVRFAFYPNTSGTILLDNVDWLRD